MEGILLKRELSHWYYCVEMKFHLSESGCDIVHIYRCNCESRPKPALKREIDVEIKKFAKDMMKKGKHTQMLIKREKGWEIYSQ